MLIKTFTLSALLLALAAAGFDSHAVEPKADTRPEFAGPSVLLSLTRADGYRMDVTVDGGGGFRNAYLNSSVGYVGDFSFDSLVMINLVEGVADDISQTGPTTAESRFSNEGLDVQLRQSLTEGSLSGSFLLTQAYRITNPMAAAATVNLYRYHDADLPPTFEAGYIRPGSRYAYMVNNPAPTPDDLTTYVGLSAFSGLPLRDQRVAVMTCCGLYEVPVELDRTVANDAAGDGVGDFVSDSAMSRRATLTLQPGQSVVVTTKTLMGATALSSLNQLPTR